MVRRISHAHTVHVQAAIVQRITIAAAFGFLVLVGYFPALISSFHSDDFVLLSEAQAGDFNLSIFKLAPNWWFYRPLGKLAWMIMYRLWGYNAAPYHLASLGLHAIT